MKLQKSYIFKKESQRGIASLIVVLALTASSIAVLGGGVAINLIKLDREPAANVNKMVRDVEDQLGVLDEEKVANSFFDDLVVGTVLLPDGSFSAYKFIDGGVDTTGNRFTGNVNISYLSGDSLIGYFGSDNINPFYLKDGSVTSAQFIDRMVANLILNDGVSYAIKIHQGSVRDGRMIGNFVGQTYDSGFLIAGTVDNDGRITNTVIKSGAQKTTETESTIAKNAISLFRTISNNSVAAKVLGISDYQTIGFNKPIFDKETGKWIFVGNTPAGSVTSTPAQAAANYIQNLAQSINSGDIFQQTAQVFQGIKEVRSTSPELSVSTVDRVAELSIDLSGVSLTLKDGDVGTGKISDGAITVSKLSTANSATNGSCLTYDSTEGKFRWGGCGSSSGGTITGITAGNGLTGGGTTGVLSLAVSVATDGGLESNAGGVSLLTTCSPDEILKWDGSSWICATDAGGVGGGISTLQMDDLTIVSSATTIDFLGSDFDLTNSPTGEGNLSIDYTNSKITRRDQTETITASWNFSSAPAISAISNTGVLTLPTSTDTLIGRNTSDTLTNKTIAAGNNTISGLSVSSFSSANISQWTNNSGYLTTNQTITLSGDVSGTGTTSITTTIGSGVVTLGKMANLAANSIIGNNTGSPAAPAALTAAQVKAMLGIATSDVSGLGTIATQSAGNVFITGGSLSGLTSVSATTFTGALTGNATSATTATTANALANTDSAGQSAITAINSATAGTINTARLNSAVTTQGNTFNGISQLVKLDSSGNLPALNGSALTGLTKSQVGLSNVENTALSTWAGSTSLNTIADKTVTLAKMADMVTSSFLGRSSVGSGAPEVLSISTVKTMLSLSTSDISGLGTIATQSASNVYITGGQLNGLATINGATISGGSISGGSLSATSVNGVTTANIILNNGNYSDPSWITCSSVDSGSENKKIGDEF